MIQSNKNNRGFISVISVILLSAGVLAFALAAWSASALYADGVNQRQMRMERSIDTENCRQTLALMHAKDYFMDYSLDWSICNSRNI
jgi:hypothetical protein